MAADTTDDEERGIGERTPFIRLDGAGSGEETVPHKVPADLAWGLYVSHFLSTWNSRVFEFGAVLYLAAISPGTLMPMSAYAFARGLSAIIMSPAVGQYIDTGNRLQVVRVSIVGQRLAVASSCAVFYVLATCLSLGSGVQMAMLLILAILACIEKLCSIMNLVSVEKDWVRKIILILGLTNHAQVIVVAEKDPGVLRVLNAQMRRIDLLCKLLGPLFISLIDGYSTQMAIIVNLGMNIASVAVEYYAIARVYRQSDALQQPKLGRLQTGRERSRPDADGAHQESWVMHAGKYVQAILRKSASDFSVYFKHRTFLASISGALLYLTVLNFAGQMVTFLLSSGYDSMQVGLARTLSVIFEVLATWVAPWLMGIIGPVRAGLWFSTWQLTMLAAGTAIFLACSADPLISASGIVGGTILSRVGLWGFDLCVQIIVQEDVDADIRGTFSSVEASWQNAFELLSYTSTMIFSRPEQFMWPALTSLGAVALACCCFTSFVYIRRGHIIHLEKLQWLSNSLQCKAFGRSREMAHSSDGDDEL
ncbi:Ferroporti-1 [Xylariales sp. PMI_506]|nr:Ferroporti-1 [Xylariales sp. PMI_506]